MKPQTHRLAVVRAGVVGTVGLAIARGCLRDGAADGRRHSEDGRRLGGEARRVSSELIAPKDSTKYTVDGVDGGGGGGEGRLVGAVAAINVDKGDGRRPVTHRDHDEGG